MSTSTSNLQMVALLVTAIALGACQAARPVVAPVLLAEGVVSPALSGALAWVADEVTLGAERVLVHGHEAAFVYAPVTPSRLTVAGQTRTLRPGQAVFVGDNVVHTHDRMPSPPPATWTPSESS